MVGANIYFMIFFNQLEKYITRQMLNMGEGEIKFESRWCTQDVVDYDSNS